MYLFLTQTHKIPAKNANVIPLMTKTKIDMKTSLFLLENLDGCSITD